MEVDPKEAALARKQIVVEQDNEVRDWTQALGGTEQELRNALVPPAPAPLVPPSATLSRRWGNT